MIGKKPFGWGELLPFHKIFDAQRAYQKKVTGMETPEDNLEHYSYHIQAMVEELGELMKADKRWKTHRNTAYDPMNKLEEIADIFITAINISLYSGFSANDVATMVAVKIKENEEKLRKVREQNDNNS